MDGGRIPVFVNRHARAAMGAVTSISTAFGDTVAIAVIEPQALHAAVAAAVAEGEVIIGVAGGDGTMHAAAAALVGTDSTLLCIPTGTMNYFALRHGITSVDEAADALRNRQSRRIAVGTLGDSYFLNTLTFGEYARVIRLRERCRRYTGKWPAAFLATVFMLMTMRRMTVLMQAGGETLTRKVPVVWVGVGWGSFPRVHQATERRSQPDLEVTIPRARTKPATTALLARLARRMLAGAAPLRDPELEVMHTRELDLMAAHSHHIDVTVDGEVRRLAGTARVGVRDAALRVIVGPAWKDSA